MEEKSGNKNLYYLILLFICLLNCVIFLYYVVFAVH